MNKKELVDFLIENFGNEYGIVNLKGLDFGDKIVVLCEMKAKQIDQSFHQAEIISQGHHHAEIIYQDYHTATEIYQFGHQARK